jgi:hypothetical protein
MSEVTSVSLSPTAWSIKRLYEKYGTKEVTSKEPFKNIDSDGNGVIDLGQETTALEEASLRFSINIMERKIGTTTEYDKARNKSFFAKISGTDYRMSPDELRGYVNTNDFVPRRIKHGDLRLPLATMLLATALAGFAHYVVKDEDAAKGTLAMGVWMTLFVLPASIGSREVNVPIFLNSLNKPAGNLYNLYFKDETVPTTQPEKAE